MKDTLLVIDSYLSNVERAYYCENLIFQIRNHFSDYKILLINKSKESFGVEKKVDYYFNFGDSFMVGYPPNEIIDSGKYSKPYVFFGTTLGTIENWMPLTGVTDHVAGIYNSFVLSSKISKLLGFEKVFKFEFDTVFHDEDLKKIKNDIESFEDYILYGQRHEGKWTTLDMIDVHMMGFKNKIFEGFDIVRNDEEYWMLCEKVRYWGKWIEYLIPAIINLKSKEENLNGIVYDMKIRAQYSLTKFDTVNSPGEWTDKWREIPVIGTISLDGGKSNLEEKLCVFYFNYDFDKINVETRIFKGEQQIHHVKTELNHQNWLYDEINFYDEIRVVSEYTSDDGFSKKMDYKINKNDLVNLRYRILRA